MGGLAGTMSCRMNMKGAAQYLQAMSGLCGEWPVGQVAMLSRWDGWGRNGEVAQDLQFPRKQPTDQATQPLGQLLSNQPNIHWASAHLTEGRKRAMCHMGSSTSTSSAE